MSQKVYVFIGVQGSGKGTQAKLLSKRFGFCHVSTGDLFRGLTGEIKTKVDFYMNKGKLIPDSLVIQLLEERVKKRDCKNGIILDGFPRNLKQAKELDKILVVNKVVEIKLSDSEALKRLSGRRICKECNEGYNIYTAPRPNIDGICNQCGGKLVKRLDDKIVAIKKRIKDYHGETEPILNYYQDKFISVNGEKSIEELYEELSQKLIS